MTLLITDACLTGVLRASSVNFTLHTEPNLSPPVFSIIFRTDGGPASYVTWVGPLNTHVQEDSDHETSQTIVDTSHNSVYENRLRVRGRESGDYYYTVIRHSNLNETMFQNRQISWVCESYTLAFS